MSNQAIAMHAALVKLNNQTGGGFKLTFEIPDNEADQIKHLVSLLEKPVYLTVIPEGAGLG